jgi:hypothetical protein
MHTYTHARACPGSSAGTEPAAPVACAWLPAQVHGEALGLTARLAARAEGAECSSAELQSQLGALGAELEAARQRCAGAEQAAAERSAERQQVGRGEALLRATERAVALR